MKRILVIGCPGAGKTYFSKRLSKILNLPLVHMDNLYWNEDKTSVDLDTLKAKLQPYLEKEEWIIDGNYHKTLEMRLPYASDVFVLDLPRKECIQGILDRIDQPRDDIPWVESEDDATELIAWTADYGFRTKDEEIALLNKNKHIKVHVINSRKEMNEYLEKLAEK
jgi:adenylate kinase family enzyme